MSEMVKWQLCRDVALLRLHGVCCGVDNYFCTLCGGVDNYVCTVWCCGVTITSALCVVCGNCVDVAVLRLYISASLMVFRC